MDNKEKVIRDFFTKYQELAVKNMEKIAGLTGRIQFDFSASGDGLWVFAIENGKPLPVINGITENPTMKITAAFDDFFAVKTGKMDPTEAFSSGKVKIDGDATFTQKLFAAGIG